MRHARQLAAALLVAALALGGCSGGGTAASSGVQPQGGESAQASAAAVPADTFPVTLTDDLGHKVTIDKRPERIVSLAPANTEIVASLGLEAKLVGVTTYDDYPPEVKSLPKVGDFMTPNLEAIAAAKPDLVLVTGGVQQDVVKKLQALGAKVLAVDPNSIARTTTAITMVGRATGTSPKAAEVVARIDAGVAEVKTKLAAAKPVSCFVEIAQNPLYTAGTDTLFDDLIRIGGGRNVVTDAGFVGFSLEQLLKDDPQVYFATKGSMSDPKGLAKRPGFDKLAAVKNGRVVLLDDNLVSRPGPRIVQGLRQIAEGLHPEAFK
jgi:iron complex transport system substrate-binding protein